MSPDAPPPYWQAAQAAACVRTNTPPSALLSSPSSPTSSSRHSLEALCHGADVGRLSASTPKPTEATPSGAAQTPELYEPHPLFTGYSLQSRTRNPPLYPPRRQDPLPSTGNADTIVATSPSDTGDFATRNDTKHPQQVPLTRRRSSTGDVTRRKLKHACDFDGCSSVFDRPSGLKVMKSMSPRIQEADTFVKRPTTSLTLDRKVGREYM